MNILQKARIKRRSPQRPRQKTFKDLNFLLRRYISGMPTSTYYDKSEENEEENIDNKNKLKNLKVCL